MAKTESKKTDYSKMDLKELTDLAIEMKTLSSDSLKAVKAGATPNVRIATTSRRELARIKTAINAKKNIKEGKE